MVHERKVYKVLVVVDVQNDFITGTLAVPHAARAVEKIVELLKTDPFPYDRIYLSQDQHPPQTKHFDKWPVHCVAGTWGADFPPELSQALVRHGLKVHYVRKGNRKDEDGYSAAFGMTGLEAGEEVQLWEDMRLTCYNLCHEVSGFEVDVVGLATDFCVLETAIDLRTTLKTDYTEPILLPEDFETTVQILPDLVAGIDPKKSEAVITLFGKKS